MSETATQDAPSWQELRSLLAGLLQAQQETERQFKETDRRMQETDRRMRETDRYLKEVGRQIGDLGRKFGSFTEGMALPSMERILRARFGMETIAPRVRVKRGEENLELDVLAYANGEVNSAYVVEVKSHLREDGIEQILDALRRFRTFFPEHRGKHLYGVVAAVDIPEQVRQRALRAGLYVACIHDDEFELTTPEDFNPLDFSAA